MSNEICYKVIGSRLSVRNQPSAVLPERIRFRRGSGAVGNCERVKV